MESSDPALSLKIALRFYATGSGSEPVRVWLKSLEAADRFEIGRDLKRVQYGWPIGMPLCRSLGDGLWEVRSALSGGRIARVIFCFESNTLVALTGFFKKTRKTPDEELERARRRMMEVQRGR
jgi:phage-related protein